MKHASQIYSTFGQVFLFIITCLIQQHAVAQLCADPGNVIYGLTNSGDIQPIDVNTGVVGAKMNPASGNAPVSSNGIGYNPLNGKFYYFKRMPGSAPQEFVVFDPATNITTLLTDCPTANFVYVGCVSANGLGYYCWDANSTLFYYNIPANTWTTITSVIRDIAGNDVAAIIRANGSGDAAIDGLGNMLMLPSSVPRFAVYRLNAPLPTMPVASITVTEIMPLTAAPAKFGGIALNNSGQIFLSSTSPANRLYRLENNLTLTLVSTLTVGMGDLTSCNFPFGVLKLSPSGFTATLKSKDVLLTWNAFPSPQNKAYTLEHSLDGINWNQLCLYNSFNSEISAKMTFLDKTASAGKNFYRLAFITGNGNVQFSPVKMVVKEKNTMLTVWPTITNNLVWINNTITSPATMVSFYDQLGRKIYQCKILPGVNSIEMKTFPTGNYLLVMNSSDGIQYSFTIIRK